VNRNDLTSSKKFSWFLGYFWSQIFEEGAFGDSIARYSSGSLSQLYKDLESSVSSVSYKDVPVFRKKALSPIVIKRSEIESNLIYPRFGDNIFYGYQPSSSEVDGSVSYGQKAVSKDKYFIELEEGFDLRGDFFLLSTGIYNADFLLLSGIDFNINSNTIYFSNNPFEIQGIKTERDQNDEYLTLWFYEPNVEKYDIFRCFGSIFTEFTDSSDLYKNTVKSFFKLLSDGPSFKNVESFLAAASGSKICASDGEMVESVYESVEGPVVVTDKNVYQLNKKQKVLSRITAGTLINEGDTLSSGVEVIDPNMNPNWWEAVNSIPARNIFSFSDKNFLSFENKLVPLSTVPVKHRATGFTKNSIRFDVIGEEDVVESFWKSIDERLSTSSFSFDDFLDLQYFSTVNPAEVFSRQIARNIILPIFVDFSQIDDLTLFYNSLYKPLSNLFGVFPLYLYVVVFGKVIADPDSIDLEGQEDSVDLVCISPSSGIELENAYVTENNPSDDEGEVKRFAIEQVLVKYRSKCTT
jgi:hypothetical protein